MGKAQRCLFELRPFHPQKNSPPSELDGLLSQNPMTPDHAEFARLHARKQQHSQAIQTLLRMKNVALRCMSSAFRLARAKF
jgi:hypothetical protein